jgi:hypothetical protein
MKMNPPSPFSLPSPGPYYYLSQRFCRKSRDDNTFWPSAGWRAHEIPVAEVLALKIRLQTYRINYRIFQGSEIKKKSGQRVWGAYKEYAFAKKFSHSRYFSQYTVETKEISSSLKHWYNFDCCISRKICWKSTYCSQENKGLDLQGAESSF